MVNEHNADYHPSPWGSASKTHPLIFLQTPSGFISLRNICWYFPQTCKFQTYGVPITGKSICESKIEFKHVDSCLPRQNFPPAYHNPSLSPPPSRHKEITDSPPGRETMYSNKCDLQNIANIDDPENNEVKKFENHQLSELIRKQFIVWKCGAYI